MENNKEAPESNTAVITSGRKQSAQQDNMFPLKPGSETDIDVEKGQQVSGSSCGKTHENGDPTVSFWAFLHARYLCGLENPSPSAGECLRITFTPSAWAVRVALLIGLFYWVDMTMNYNDFRVIPQAAVETWKQKRG